MKKVLLSLFVAMIAFSIQSFEIRLQLPKMLPQHDIKFLPQIGYEEILPTLSFVHSLANPHTLPQKYFAQNKCLATFSLLMAAKCAAAKLAGRALDNATKKSLTFKSDNHISIQ